MYSHFSHNDIIVQKYGGTSVGSPERIRAVAERIVRLRHEGWKRLAVTVSAMSGDTNRLVDLVRSVNPDVSAKFYDMAISAGEQVSVALVAAAIEACGETPEMFLAYQLGIHTDDFHAKARVQSIDVTKIHQAWERGRIPVIAGFQGVSSSSDITTLGRGGSDTSAVAVASALKAAFCEINTDVNGVYTADPRIVSNARLIPFLDYEVALEMASLGSKVLHSRCVEIGAKFNLPITVRNSFRPDDTERTVIMHTANHQNIESPVVSGVTLDRNVARITLTSPTNSDSWFSDVFSSLAEHGVNVDIIVHDRNSSSGQWHLGFTAAKDEINLVQKSLASLKAREPFQNLTAAIATGLAKVSIVGVGMRSYVGVASKTFNALAEQKIDVQMISTSEIKISCLVDEARGEDAMRALHRTFID
jgi:aspartate kinase